ncbi:MAG: carboxypeptidase regulatory-like domain-containing protein [Terriglobales bacterium]
MKSICFAIRNSRVVSHRGALYLASLVVLIIGFSSLALSQGTTEATVVGTVTDPTGSVIPNVDITIMQTETGQLYSTKTNQDGQYTLPALQVGHYSLKAEAPGFKVAERKDLVLNVGDRYRADFSMQVGSTQESVTVEAEAIKVQSDSGEVSDVITGQQVTQLESNGRSLYSLANLTPGASSLQTDSQVPTPMGGDQNISFNGQRVAHNLYLIDGAEAADRGGSGAIVMPSEDAIAEFRELTSNYSAEFGASSAASVTTVLKSGTKRLHASAWEFDRNDALDARNYFNPVENANGTRNKVSELRFNVFGFNVGGPVEFKRSDSPKTFFFYNMEWRKQISGGNLNRVVPFPTTYGGNLSDAINFNGGALLNKGFTNVLVPQASQLSPAEQQRFINDGLTFGQPFTNNTIPTNLLDPNAQLLLKAGIYPSPTSGDAFIGSAPAPTNVKEELVRVDHTFTDKFSVFGHWISEQILQTDIPTRWSGDNLPTIGDTFANPSYSATIHTTYVISPTLLNEASFNYDGNRINILPIGLSQLPSGYSSNRIFNGKTNIIPVIGLGGKTGATFDANWVPWINSANDYQIRDDVSWTKRSHQIKMGGSFALFKKAQPLQVDTQGNFGFNGSFTGYDFADFLLGFSNSYSENALKDTRQWNAQSWAAYIQDDWRATSRLTLNLGLRWDGLPHTYEANNQQSNFYPNLYNPANAPVFANASGTQICTAAGVPAGCAGASPGLGTSPNPLLAGYQFYLNGIGIAGVTPGVTNALVQSHWLAFGPRLGFAYDLTGSGKTVVRGGFGIMYERIQGNDMYQNASDAPFSDSVSGLTTVSLSDPHVNVTTGDTLVSPPLPVVVQGVSALNSSNYQLPESFQYSAGVQRQLSSQSVLSIAYVGSQDRHQSYAQELNLPPQSDLANIMVAKTIPYNRDLPYLGYSSIKYYQDGGNSHYNSLQVELHSNLRHELQLQAAYTLSKAIDPTSGTGGDGFDLDSVSNPYLGWRGDNGPSIFDRRHVAFVDFIYDIPLLKNSSNHLLKSTVGGWQLSGVVTMESGAPINIGVSGTNVCNSGLKNCSVRPNLTGPIQYTHTATTLGSGQPTVQWFNPASFTANTLPGSTIATFGNLGHDALYGPGRDNWNLALFKSFVISESRGSRFEMRFESYNTWNHTQFIGNVNQGGINSSVGNSDFGKFTSAADPRVFQLGAKLVF